MWPRDYEVGGNTSINVIVTNYQSTQLHLPIMSMFAPQTLGAAVSPKVGLHSFKAGKLNRVEGTNRVKPESRKGLIYLEEVDELLHFYWKDRNTGAVEDDLIIFPDEAEFVKVQESPSGRVFALKFSSSSQIMFYWMQEKDSANDGADVERVNALIADPKAPAPRSAQPAQGMNLSGLGGMMNRNAPAGLGDLDLSSAAQTINLTQDQLMEILGSNDLSQIMGQGAVQNLFGAQSGRDAELGDDVMDTLGSEAISEQLPVDPSGPANPSGEATASAGQQAAISHINDGNSAASKASSNETLKNILAGIQVPAQQQEAGSEPLDLQDVLTPELVSPLLANVEVRQRLFPHLPSSLVSDPPTETEVRDIMNSVQWRQALSGLSYALNHGGESAIRSLGIDASQLEGTSGVEAFIRAVARVMQQEETQDGDRMEE